MGKRRESLGELFELCHNSSYNCSSYAQFTVLIAFMIVAGTNLRLTSGEAGGIRYADQTWIVAYHRGALFTQLPYNLADLIFSATDVIGLYDVIKAWVLCYWNEVSLGFGELMAAAS